jgi:Leucine-rich repeat (LRR) protein
MGLIAADSAAFVGYEEEVTIVETMTQPSDIKTKQEAVAAMIAGKTHSIEDYLVVKRHETLQGIAQKHYIAMESTIAENEGLTAATLLEEGTWIKLVIIQPYLTVIAEGVYSITEEIDFETEIKKNPTLSIGTTMIQKEGEKGTKNVTYTFVSKNGVTVIETLIEEIITKKPVTEIIYEGTQSIKIYLSYKGITDEKLSAMVNSGEIPQNVNELSLNSNFITDITPLKSLTNLTKLNLDINQIRDVSPLKSLTELTILHLYDNKITDISPLASLTKLKALGLARNSVSHIAALETMTDLKALSLVGNKITSFTPLKSLRGLEVLWALQNPGLTTMSDPKLEDIQKLVPNCKILDHDVSSSWPEWAKF